MNTFKKRTRTSFDPQMPQRVPWVVISALSVSLSFLIGQFSGLKGAGDSSEGTVIDALRDQSLASIGTKHSPQIGLNPVADTVSTVEPAVVSIDTIMHEKRSELSLPDFLLPDSTNGKLPKLETYEAHGAGSGIIVRSDGYILTNSHVVKDADEISVTLRDGRKFIARVLGKDAYSDIALLKIAAAHLPVAKLGSSKNVRPGDWAIAIGSPLGLSQTVTMGIVSAVGRSLADLNNNVDLIQTDAAINPGNSGGPLINIRGEVVGINMAIRSDAQNIGFSIPIDVAREAATSIIDQRPIIRPYLGLSTVDFDPQLAENAGVPTIAQGVLVSKVASRGPAAASGLSKGDLIQSVQNSVIHKGSDLQHIIRRLRVGDKLVLGIFREGKQRKVSVTLAAYPAGKDELNDES